MGILDAPPLRECRLVSGPGIDYTGATDSSSAVQAIIASARTAQRDVQFLSGTLRLDSGLGTWDSSVHSLLGAGTTILDMTRATSGFQLTVIGQDSKSSSYGFRPILNRLAKFVINGPTADATTADFCRITDVNNGSQPSFEHLMVTGFRDQWTWGDNVWCSQLYRVASGRALRRVLRMTTSVNTAENLEFIGCVFFSSHNTAGNAAALSVSNDARADNNFIACSFDYNDIEFDIASGNSTFTNCHIENNNPSGTTPLGRISYTSSFETTNVTIVGGAIALTEQTPATGRTHAFEIVSGDRCAIDMYAVRWESYGKSTELVRLTSGVGRVNIQGGIIPVGGGGIVAAPGAMNLLYNGSFDTGNLAPWSVGGTGTNTITASTVQAENGTYSALVAGTVGATGTKMLSQRFPCRPGQSALFTCDAITDAYTSGDIIMMVNWYAIDDTTLIRSDPFTLNAQGRINAGLSAWTRKGGITNAPPGAAFAEARFQAGSFVGNAYLDNCVFALI